MTARALRILGTIGLAALLAACVAAAPPAGAPSPSATAPQARPAPGLDPGLVRLYAAQERRLVSQGLLRRDGTGPDARFGARDLARAFVRVALFDEYREGANGRLVQSTTRSNLRRWRGPVRIGVTFGDAVPAAQRAKDRIDIARYATRLARATGHPISVSAPENANFHVLVLSEGERRAAGPAIKALIPRISPASVRAATDLPTSIYCLALAFSEPDTFGYTSALAVVRAEHPDLTRLSCYHEEIAQGLGLANDDPAARPSIFNDDEEFALLTGFDELLLEMLYDPRMRPGMTPAEAAPIAVRIASELIRDRGV